MEATIRKIVGDCNAHPMSGANALRALLERDRQRFLDSAVPVIRESGESHGVQLLLALLLAEGMLTEALCNPRMFTLDEACAIAERLKRVDSQFDVRLLRSQVRNNGKTTAPELQRIMGSAAGIRMLDILAVVSDGARILPTIAQLLNHPSSHVRSKAALLVGRSNKNYRWVQERLEESDPRVRANAVESLWGSDTEGSQAVFRTALADEDNRVVGNALLGLYRLGDATSIPMMIEMMSHEKPQFRTSAVWVMGETGDPRFAPILARIISESSTELRGAALRAIAKLKKATAARSTSEELTIFAGRRRRGNQDSYLFTAALGARKSTIPELQATNFALWEDCNLVKNYSVRHITKTEPIALALAIARIIDYRTPLYAIQERAVELALRHKRRNDIWMLLKYLSLSQDNPGVDKTEVLPPGDDDLSNVRMRFTADPEVVMDAVAAPVSRLACAADLHQACRTLIRSAGLMRGARHLVLVCPSPLDGFTRDVSQVAAAAEVSGVAVHVITCAADEGMNKLCSYSGGTRLIVSSMEEIPSALERLYASLLNSYEVCYQRENESASKLKMQIHTAQLAGECVLDLN